MIRAQISWALQTPNVLVMITWAKIYYLRFRNLPILIKGCVHRIFHEGDPHVQVLLLEDLCNRSPGFCALVVREETPSPLPVGGPTASLLKFTIQQCVVVTPRNGFVLLLSAGGGPALSGSPFRLGVPHQIRVQTPLPEVHLLR